MIENERPTGDKALDGVYITTLAGLMRHGKGISVTHCTVYQKVETRACSQSAAYRRGTNVVATGTMSEDTVLGHKFEQDLHGTLPSTCYHTVVL